MGGGFWDILSKIGALATLVGICAGGYQVWVPDERIQHNHMRIASYVGWGARAGWLDTLKLAVARALHLLSWIYGQPADGRTGMRAFLTVGAWKMSARIATFIIFVLPLFYLPVLAIQDSADLSWPTRVGRALALAALAFTATLPFYFTRDSVRPVEQSRNLRTDLRESVTKTARCAFIALMAAIGMSIISRYFQIIPANTSGYIVVMVAFSFCVIAIFIALFIPFLDSIRRFGFQAPIMFVAQLLVVGTIVFAVIAYSPFQPITASMPQPHDQSWHIKTAFVVICCSVLGAWLGTRWHTWIRAILLAVPLMCLIAVSTWLAVAIEAQAAYSWVVYPVFAVAVPITLLLYAAVFANSLPDWVSIAATRTILSRSLLAERSGQFARFIALDVLVVALCCCLTLIISVTAFALAFSSNWLVISAFGVDPQWTSIGFFESGMAAPWRLVSSGHLMLDLPTQRPGIEGMGELAVAVIFLVGLTSALPTLFNALMMVLLIAGRLLARTIGPSLLTIHALLIVDADTSSDQRARRVARSTMIVGIIGAAVLSGIILVLDGLGRVIGGH